MCSAKKKKMRLTCLKQSQNVPWYNYTHNVKKKKSKRVIPLKRKTNFSAKYSQIKQRRHKRRDIYVMLQVSKNESRLQLISVFSLLLQWFRQFHSVHDFGKELKKTFDWMFRVLFKKQFTPKLNSEQFIFSFEREQKDENFNSFSLSYPEYIHLLWRGGYLKKWENSI